MISTRGLERLIPWTIKNTSASNEFLLGSAFIVLSLFLGFFLQMINKLIILRDRWAKDDLQQIALDEKTHSDFTKATGRLNNLVKQIKNEEDIDKNFRYFYFMDNYVWANQYNAITQLFHQQISLWANIMTASIFYIAIIFILSLIVSPMVWYFNQVQFVLAFAVFFFSIYFTKKSIHRFHDAVIKTFLVTTDKKLKEGFLRK